MIELTVKDIEQEAGLWIVHLQNSDHVLVCNAYIRVPYDGDLTPYVSGAKFALLPMADEISPVCVETLVERTLKIGEKFQ